MSAQSQERLEEGILEDERIKKKADAFIAMLEQDNEDSDSVDIEDTDFIVSHDVNGVWISTDGSGEGLKKGAYEALEELNLGQTHLEVFTSGNPVSFLKDLKESEMPDHNLGLIGEMGTVYENGEGTEFVYPEKDPRELFDVAQDLYDKAAEEEVKLMLQDDYSNVKLCFRAEAEHRSGLDEEVKAQGLDDIRKELEPYDGFEYDPYRERVVFENNLKNAAILTDTLRYNFRFPGIRFEETEDGRLAFYRDLQDDLTMDLDEVHDFIEEDLPEDVETYENDDYGVDVLTVDPEEDEKLVGMKSFAEEYSGNNGETVYAHAGDKESDVFEDRKTYLFPIEGENAHEYCLENGIPHIPVEDGAEYAKIMGEVADRK